MDVSGLLSFTEVMKYCLTEECLMLFNVKGISRKTQKSNILLKLTLQSIDVLSYTVLVYMGMIWWLASPTAVDREKGDGILNLG